MLAAAHGMLKPGGALLVVNHAPPTEPAPGIHPLIPYDLISEVLERYGVAKPANDPAWERHEVLIGRSPFGSCKIVILPGRRDLLRSPEDIVDNMLSTSLAAPERFGNRLADFQFELAARLSSVGGPDGMFWEFPGDTEVLIARR